MRANISFRTSRFDSTTPKPDFINPTTGFGEDLMIWLVQTIQHSAILLDTPIQEDYGWGVWAKVSDELYWIAVSINEETIGSEVAEWLMTIAYEPGCNLFRRIFHQPRREDFIVLCRAVDAALQSDPAVLNIQWWEHDFDQGQPSAHPA